MSAAKSLGSDSPEAPWYTPSPLKRRPPTPKEVQSYFQKSGRGGITKGVSLILALVLLMACFSYFSHLTLTRTNPFVEGEGDSPFKQSLDKARGGGFSWEGNEGTGKGEERVHDIKNLLEEHQGRKDEFEKKKKEGDDGKDDEESGTGKSSVGKKDANERRAVVKKDAKRLNKRKNQEEHIELSKVEPKVHNYHPDVSPRPGTDISGSQNQLSILRCPNQSKCIVPELQLKPKNKIYLCKHPVRHGVRFYFLIREGLLLHPNVVLVDEEHVEEADYVFYLPGSSPWHRTECTNSSLADKLIVMDEFDGHSLFYPFKTKEEVKAVYGEDMVWYFMYFKRSFVARRDGKFMGHPHLNRPDVYPMTYAIAEAYIQAKFNFVREIEVLCTLRGNKRMTTRMRVQQWIADYTKERGLKNAITSQINGATRTTVSKSYFAQMYNAQIIVTVNPANWEGDFRLWESFATGALIFVDPIFVPHGYPLVNGVHAVFYDNNNQTDLVSKLDYYRNNTEEARRIAVNGYLHAMKYHRTVNIIDYVLRSAHLKASLIKQAATVEGHEDRDHVQRVGSRLVKDRPGDTEVPAYTFTAQYLNHQTLDQGEDIAKNNKPGDYRAVSGLHHDGDHEPHSLSHMEVG